MRIFSSQEREILQLVQGDLPESLTPFADMAKSIGIGENDFLSLLEEMKQGQQIRRFGATLRHQQAGYSFNAMVAWYVDEDDIIAKGEYMASHKEISHCYQRKNCLEWPYNLYTMVHSKNRVECLDFIKKIADEAKIADYDILFSKKELKKTSMIYF